MERGLVMGNISLTINGIEINLLDYVSGKRNIDELMPFTQQLIKKEIELLKQKIEKENKK